MKTTKLPKTDSIHQLAKFWDSHDLTDFESELEEVSEPVFVRCKPIKMCLQPDDAKAVKKMAQSKGVSEEELIRTWVLQKLGRRQGRRSSGKLRS